MHRDFNSAYRNWIFAALLAVPLLATGPAVTSAAEPGQASEGDAGGSGGGAGPDASVAGAVTGPASQVSAVMGGEGGERVIVIDVRPRADFAKGHLKNAKNVEVRYSEVLREHSFDKTALGTDKNARIVVYGANANDPAAAAVVRTAQAEGFSNVIWMRGGFAEWVAARLPTTTS